MSISISEVKDVFKMSREELYEYNKSKLSEFKELFLTTDLPVDEIYAKIGVSKGDPTYRYITGQREKEGLSAKNRKVNFQIKEQSTEERYAELEDFYQQFKKLWLSEPKISKKEAYNRLGKNQTKERLRYVNQRMEEDGLENHYPFGRKTSSKKWGNPGRNNNVINTKTKIYGKTPEEAYEEYKHYFFNSELSIAEIYEKIGVPRNQNTHYIYIRKHAEMDGLNAHVRRINLKHGGRPKGSKNLKNLTDEEKEKMDKYFEENYQEFLKYYQDETLSVQDILKKMGTHHKSNMYFYFRKRMAEDGLDPTKRQGKIISHKVKKTYAKRRKENEAVYEEAYQEYKDLFLNTKLDISEIYSELDIPDPRNVCAKYIRKRAKEDGLNAHKRRWKNFEGHPITGEKHKQREECYQKYKQLFLETDMNIMDIYKEINVSYDSKTGHYIREKGLNEGLDTFKRRSQKMIKSKCSDEECEELFQEYKKLFKDSQLKIPEIYEKIGVMRSSYQFKYIRKRCLEEGLDGKKRMYDMRRNKKITKKNKSYNKHEGRYKSKYSERTLKQVDNSMDTLKQVFLERNIKENTIKGYVATMYHWFEQFGDKYNTIQEVIDFYISEEDERIPMRERTIKSDLLKFREYLINCESMTSSKSIMSYYSKLTAVLRHFGLEIPSLPKAKLEKGYVSNYNDLPTHDMIRTACEQSPDVLKAVILFMSSSGSAKAETLSITVGMFLEGCGEYLTQMPTPNNINQCLEELKDRHDIVPLIYLRRIKTDKWYFTCCSPEASYYIVKYLNSNVELKWDDQLFPFGSSLLLTRFQEINDRNNWGKVGKYRRFRGHVLRKFMASNIGLPRDQVDSFQGRSKDMIQEAYFKQDPKQLKKIYMGAMHRVMIYDNWGHDISDSEPFNDVPVVSEPAVIEEPVAEISPEDEVIETQIAESSNEDNSMSIADELLKYSQLQKDGFLTMDEFNKIKSKLLEEL